MNLQTLKKMYKDLKSETGSFTKLSPEILQKDPRRLTVFRILLNMKQIEAKRKLTPSICDYETGRYTKIQRKKAIEIVEKIKREIDKIELNEELLEKNYKNLNGFREEMLKKGLNALSPEKKTEVIQKIREGVINNINKRFTEEKDGKSEKFFLTDQEKKIATILNANKIVFKQNYYLKNINVDFVFFNENIPKGFLMATEIKTKRYSTKNLLIERIALRGFRLKKYFPNLKSIVFVSIEYLTPSQSKLLEEAYDVVLINDFSSITKLF